MTPTFLRRVVACSAGGTDPVVGAQPLRDVSVVNDIVIESVSIYGQLFAQLNPTGYTDDNNDGVMELMVKFDRAAFEQLVP